MNDQPQIKVKIAEIANIDSVDLGNVQSDYEAAGTEVKVTRQDNGKFKLEAWAKQGGTYPASGAYLR